MIPKTLSHYRIAEELGRGGMGVVYKAEDTKLDRTVALKLLPPHALVSEDDRARFYREARAAAALNHPNIAHVYEIDEAEAAGESRPFIAMEFIDGETLAERIAKGPLPLKDAISYASQIAEGLKVAHEAHVVHRDIKSGNIMLTKKGVVKILDFGLAKTTASTKLTQMGSTLGTVAYMSPEQAKGEEVDRRSDVWSLGVILYEMITGRLPFKGDYEQAVVYGILNEDPESLTTLRAGVPMALDGIIAKMLAKDPDLRYQHVDELPADLKAVDLGSAVRTSRIATSRTSMSAASAELNSVPDSSVSAGRFTPSLVRAWPVVLVAAVAMFGLGWFLRPGPVAETPLRKLLLTFPGMHSITYPAVSHEGRWMAFAGTDTAGSGGVFLYEMSTGSVLRIPGSEQYNYGRFSPDGTQLLLASNANAGAATMVVPNGVPNEVVGRGLWHVWETNDTVLYTAITDSGLTIQRATLDGREPEHVALADSSLDWATQPYVEGLLPGGMLIGGIQADNGSRHAIALLDPDTGVWSIGEEGVANPSYAGDGYVTYQVGNDLGKLVARRMDPISGAFAGPPREVLPGMRWGEYSVGDDGSLVFVPQAVSDTDESRLFLLAVDPPSLRRLNLSTDGGIFRPSFAPRGNEIALEVLPARGSDRYIAVYDIATGVLTKRTFAGTRRNPRWSSDGVWLYYNSEEPAIYRRRADGSGDEELVIEEAAMPELSPDGKWLLATDRSSDPVGDLIGVELASGRRVVVDSSDGTQMQAHVSPSSRYVAYRTFVASGEERIAVRPIEGSAYWIVSDVNANRPRWSPDERFIYFVSPGQGIFRIAVSTEQGFRTTGEPERIGTAYGDADFDIEPGGRSLIVAGAGVSLQEASRSGATLGWWQNWVQSLPDETGL